MDFLEITIINLWYGNSRLSTLLIAKRLAYQSGGIPPRFLKELRSSQGGAHPLTPVTIIANFLQINCKIITNIDCAKYLNTYLCRFVCIDIANLLNCRSSHLLRRHLFYFVIRMTREPVNLLMLRLLSPAPASASQETDGQAADKVYFSLGHF